MRFATPTNLYRVWSTLAEGCGPPRAQAINRIPQTSAIPQDTENHIFPSLESYAIMSQHNLDEFHRETAKKCFNETWNYLEKKDRDADDEQQMLHLAHTARYHRSFVGTDRNFAIGDWLISRLYAALNEPRLALHLPNHH